MSGLWLFAVVFNFGAAGFSAWTIAESDGGVVSAICLAVNIGAGLWCLASVVSR